MFRIFYLLFGAIGSICALITPIAIAHWLLKATHVTGAAPFVKILDPFLMPLNTIVSNIAHTPPLTVNGQTIPTEPALVALGFTILFFIFSILAESLKTAEQRAIVMQESMVQAERFRQNQLANEKHRGQVVAAGQRILLNIGYNFPQCEEGAKLIRKTFEQFQPRILHSLDNRMILQFSSLDYVFRYTLEVDNILKRFYKSLRPMDPHPALFLTIHATASELNPTTTAEEVEKIAQFAAPHQIMFSQSVKDLMDAERISAQYEFQTTGLYNISGKQAEIFRLFKKREA